jgi:hypothetical protein
MSAVKFKGILIQAALRETLMMEVNENLKRSLEITCSIGPITIIGTRVIIQKACLKPFSSHAPVNTHISNEKGTYNLYNNRPTISYHQD